MKNGNLSDENLNSIQQKIDWVLDNPDMSSWLKDALRSGCSQQPITLLNDLEILNTLLRSRCIAMIEGAFTSDSFEEKNSDN